MTALHAHQVRRPDPQLHRAALRTSRLLDFCRRKELMAQTGHQPDAWPLVFLKELVDNALDACEEAGAAPVIDVQVDNNGITVSDIPAKDTLADAYRRDRAQALAQARIETVLEEMQEPGQGIEIPDDLHKQVERHLRENSAISWDEAVREIASGDEEGAT